jgi:hypothetical protein
MERYNFAEHCDCDYVHWPCVKMRMSNNCSACIAADQGVIEGPETETETKSKDEEAKIKTETKAKTESAENGDKK